MNKKTFRLLITFLTVIFCITMVTSICFAEFTPASIDSNTTLNSEAVKSVGNNIAAIIRTIGIVASVVILMILGIKYMMGSAAEKAEYKKTMIPYVIGAVILFGASALAGAIVEMAQGITGTVN